MELGTSRKVIKKLVDFKDRSFMGKENHKEMAKMREWRADRVQVALPSLIPRYRDRYSGSRDSYIK